MQLVATEGNEVQGSTARSAMVHYEAGLEASLEAVVARRLGSLAWAAFHYG